MTPTTRIRQGVIATAGSPAKFTNSYEFVTIPNVELFAVGTWDASTGTVSITPEDLQSAITALDDPAVPTPRLKIGHEDNLFNEQPCFGKVDNLRLSTDGMTLIGDFVGVPKWLADIMASAFPSRSIEGLFGLETATDRKHQFVMTACALLGTSLPAVETLEDLQAMYYSNPVEYIAEDFIAAAGHAKQVTFNTYKEGTMPRPLAAATSVEDIRNSYYDQLSMDQGWWWIREVHYDPSQLIVDMDGNGLVRVPFSADDSGNIEFGEPTEVRIEYVDTPQSGEVAASKTVTFSSRAESRPTNNNTEESDMANAAQLLGLAEDATEEEVAAEASRLRALDATPTTDGDEDPAPEATNTATIEVPEGMKLVEEEVLAGLQEKANRGDIALTRLETGDRDSYLDGKMRQGYFGKARMGHFQTLYDADPEGTRDLLDNKMAAGLVPTEERGGTPSQETGPTGSTYNESWLSKDEQDRIKRARGEA